MTQKERDTPKKTYRCAECWGTFNEGWDDKKAQQEAVDTFCVRGDHSGMAMVW